MPVQKSKSSLLGKLGPQLRQAHEQHRNDETEFSSFGDLPAGMSGVARLVDCKFDTVKEGKTNAGEYYFYAAGVVVAPKEFKDKQGVTHRVEGMRTSIMEMMCDTPNSKSRKTINDHYAWVLNELRKLGVDTGSVEVDDLEITVQAIKEAQPTFKFRTWQGEPTKEYPNPRVNHSWEGQCDYDEDEDGGGAVQDDTAQAPPPPPRNTQRSPAPTTNGSKNGVQLTPGKTPTPVVPPRAPRPAVAQAATKAAPKAPTAMAKQPEFNEMDTAESVLALANAGDEDAQQKLADMAIDAGADEQAVSDAPDWDAVYQLIQDATGGGEATDTEEPAWEPQKGEVYKFTPPGAKRTFEVEVLEVNGDTQTVTLKNLDNPKLSYKSVAWDKLVVPE